MTNENDATDKRSFFRRKFLENHFMFLNLGILLALAVSGLLGPMIIEVAADLDVEQWQINLIPSAFGATVACLSFLWVTLETKFPRKYLFISATLIWASAVSIIGFFFFFDIFSSYEQLFISMELAAIGFAGIVPISYSMTMDLYAPDRRGKAFGFIDMSSSLGTGFAPLLAGFLVEIQWAIPFIIVGVLGYAVNIFLVRIKEPKRGCQEAQLAELIRSGAEYRFGLTRKGVKTIFKKKANVLLFGMIFFYVTSQAGLAFFFITMLKNDHGYAANSELATLIFMAIYQVQIYASVIWGWHADKMFAKRPDGKIISILISLSIGIIPYMIGYSLKFQMGDLPMLIIFSILITIGAFFVMGVSARAALTMGEINPPEVRATTFALNYLCDTGGSSFGYFLVGVLFLTLFNGSYQYGMVMVCLGYLGSMALALIVRNMIPRELENLKATLEDRAKELGIKNNYIGLNSDE